jgi:hypothetical protein
VSPNLNTNLEGEIMGITRAVIGAVAAAGVARLLAPKQTEEVVEGAKRAVAAGTRTASRKMKAAMPRTKAAAAKTAKKAAAKTTKTVRKAAKRATKRK